MFLFDFIKANWELLVGLGVFLVFLIAAAAYFKHGSRRSSGCWMQGVEFEGNNDWRKLALTRKKESLTVEGWAKSEWGLANKRMRMEIDVENGVVYHIEVPYVTIVVSHIIWTSVLRLGDYDNWRESQVFEGETLQETENGLWVRVPAEEKIVCVEKLPEVTAG